MQWHANRANRGIDVPLLANVINYDFPAQPKIFVHRGREILINYLRILLIDVVGRTARAGQQGWSYSLIKESDCPYLLDLQLFLGKPIVVGRTKGEGKGASYVSDICIGALPRDKVSTCAEWVSKLMDENVDLAALRSVAAKGEKLYHRTRNPASAESAKRAKEVSMSTRWMELHPLFNDETTDAEIRREEMLARLSGFRPQETVFEVNRKGNQSEAGAIAQKRRQTMQAKKRKHEEAQKAGERSGKGTDAGEAGETSCMTNHDNAEDLEVTDDFSDLEITITNTFTKPLKTPSSKLPSSTVQDTENYMSYRPTSINLHEERGYSVHSSSATHQPLSSFLTDARAATMDLTADEATAFAEPARMRWDKRHKKYVSTANDGPGRDGKRGKSNAGANSGEGKKWIKGESGARIAASFKSGRFEAWKRANRIERLPRVGEKESTATPRFLNPHIRAGGGPDSAGGGGGGNNAKRYRHQQEKAPKDADRWRDDYQVRKKRVEGAREKRVGRFREGYGKNEVKGVGEMQRERMKVAARREKTGRHGKGRGRR